MVGLQRDILVEGRWFIRRPSEANLDVEACEHRIRVLDHASDAGWWVARRERRLVGMMTLIPPPFHRCRHVVKLEIMVARDARGQGVGRALLEAGQQWVREHEVVEKIGLNVFADNTAALALYARAGFVEEGRRIGEYRMEDGTRRDDVLLCWFARGATS